MNSLSHEEGTLNTTQQEHEQQRKQQRERGHEDERQSTQLCIEYELDIS